MKIRGQIIDASPKSNDRKRFQKWLDKHEGCWYVADYKILGKHKDPKSAAQLGYFFGLLLPEIHDQFVADGYTITIKHKGTEIEIQYTEDASYEHLTAICGHVGENGKHMRISDEDMTLVRMISFIDNALKVAEYLNMNIDELKARRPE